MIGLELVAIALQQIGANFRAALYYSLPFIAYNSLLYAYNLLGFGNGLPAGGNPLIMLLKWACIVWPAVLWHRFILKNMSKAERLRGITKKLFWAYSWRFLLVGFLVILVRAVSVIAWRTGISGAENLGANSPADWNPAIYAFSILPFWIAYRLSLVLPAVALNEKITFRESWWLTASRRGEILMVAVFTACGIAASQTIFVVMLHNNPFLAIVTGFTLEWVIFMFNISILTTLYGQLKKGC